MPKKNRPNPKRRKKGVSKPDTSKDRDRGAPVALSGVDPTGDARSAPTDFAFNAIVALIVLISLWLLLMPWVPAIASATLHRFHLRTGSFVAWAAQQPIPSMYNFGNRFEVREVPADLFMPVFDTTEKRYINHFPTRVLTFANTRYNHLHDGRDRWLTIDSTYRGQTLETRYHAKPREDGGYDMILLPDEDLP